MAGIFEGLEKFGLNDFSNVEIFTKKDSSSDRAGGKKTEVFNAKNFLYSKEIDCPVCGKTFNTVLVRTSKLKLVTIEQDLRPVHEPIDPLFYDAVICVKCGYGAVKQQFDKITDKQIEFVEKQLCTKYKPCSYPDELTVDMAIERYRLVLLNAIIKNAKDGEKAYICMKLIWLFRIKGDLENEMLFVKMALDGFTRAYEEEFMPIMGLEECTIVYLLGAFSKVLGYHDEALRYLSNIIVSKTATSRLKDRARELKDEILEMKKN